MRSTANAGDVIAVTGLGGPLGGRTRAPGSRSRSPDVADATRVDVTAAHLRPRPRTREGQWLAAAGRGHVDDRSLRRPGDRPRAPVRRERRRRARGARTDPGEPTVHAIAKALDRDALAWATGGGRTTSSCSRARPGPSSGWPRVSRLRRAPAQRRGRDDGRRRRDPLPGRRRARSRRPRGVRSAS